MWASVFFTLGTLLAFIGRFDVLDVFLYLFFEDFSHKLSPFDVQKVIEIVDVASVGGVVADFVAVIEQSIETLVKESPNVGRGCGGDGTLINTSV